MACRRNGTVGDISPTDDVRPAASQRPRWKTIMSMNCEVVLHWQVTPPQLRALGLALWSWCSGAGQNWSRYQLLDSQGLADLIAGRIPAPNCLPQRGEPWRLRLCIQDTGSSDRQTTIARL